MSAARARVEAALAAARVAFGPGRDRAIDRALADESGLSLGTISWALEEVLELHPSREALALMSARAQPRAAIAVLLAGNVPTAPLRAVVWALAAAPHVIVRPSRRATAFVAHWLAAAPALAAHVELVPLSEDPAADAHRAIERLPEDSAVHVYGGEATIAAVAAAAAPRGIATELHGPGLGAIVARSEEIVASATAIAEDFAAFDQRGCLSPRLLLSIGDASAAERAATALDRALAAIGAQRPRGRLDPEESASIARARDAAIYAGFAIEGRDHLIMVVERPAPGPIGRVVPITPVANVDEASGALAPLRAVLTTVAHGREPPLELPAGVRRAPLGAMQRPPLDGPVDLRPLIGRS
jgi:hypothetical protein